MFMSVCCAIVHLAIANRRDLDFKLKVLLSNQQKAQITVNANIILYYYYIIINTSIKMAGTV